MADHPRRFYKTASATPENGVALDARTLRTPGGAVFAAPTTALAEAVADEWNAQAEQIVPATMPVTQLAFAAIDWTRPAREQRAGYVASYGQTDLCCHRADAPAGLVARQAAAWDPLVNWGEEALGIRLPVVVGVIAAKVPDATVATLRARALALDDFRLTGLSQATGLTGSALIGFALLERQLDPAQAFNAAMLDDLWSFEHWGEDMEARARLDRVQLELDALARFVAALSS